MVANRDQYTTLSNFKVVCHAQPIGDFDAAIAILDLRTTRDTLYRKA